MIRRDKKFGPMCWLCNGTLTANKVSGQLIFVEVGLPNGTKVKVHKTCAKDTRDLAAGRLEMEK